DSSIQLLQISKVLHEKTLDNSRIYFAQRSESDNHTRKQNDGQISWIALHSGVFLRENLISGCGELHYPFLVQIAVLDEPIRQRELVFSLKRHNRIGKALLLEMLSTQKN